jgi:hypothetical protein
VGFFEAPPPPPELPPLHLPPEWLSPPSNVLGRSVDLDIPIVKTDDVAVQVRNFVAYPMGIAFVLDVRRRKPRQGPFEDPLGQHPHFAQEPDEILRFGVQYPDGGKATTVRERGWPGPGEQPAGPRLNHHMGGGGDGQRWEMGFWLWPLPGEGQMSFVAEWPAYGVDESRVYVDTETFREPAGRADLLWKLEPVSEGPWGDVSTIKFIGSDSG